MEERKEKSFYRFLICPLSVLFVVKNPPPFYSVPLSVRKSDLRI
jgi:hypothetical protein